MKIAPILPVLLLCGAAGFAQNSPQSSFGPISVPGTSAIFDPDSVLTTAQRNKLGGTPAVKALSFTAAAGQIFTFSASGQAGNSVNGTSGPDGFSFSVDITSLGSISGFVAPVAFPLVGVFTNGAPGGPAPGPSTIRAAARDLCFRPC